jgi:hypothetical protein
MNINIWTFLQQCAAMAVWVFLVAAIWAIVERLLDTYVPGFLDVEAEGASQKRDPIPDTPPVKQV